MQEPVISRGAGTAPAPSFQTGEHVPSHFLPPPVEATALQSLVGWSHGIPAATNTASAPHVASPAQVPPAAGFGNLGPTVVREPQHLRCAEPSAAPQQQFAVPAMLPQQQLPPPPPTYAAVRQQGGGRKEAGIPDNNGYFVVYNEADEPPSKAVLQDNPVHVPNVPIVIHVSDTLRDKIAKGKYVPMCELLPGEKEYTQTEMVMHTGDDGKSKALFKAYNKDRRISHDQWQRGWLIFSAVRLRTEPHEHQSLLNYAAQIRNLWTRHADWRSYDQNFRKYKELTQIAWDHISGAMFLDCHTNVVGGATGADNTKSNKKKKNKGRNQQKGPSYNFPRLAGYCWPWNAGQCEFKGPHCRKGLHSCTICEKAGHPANRCYSRDDEPRRRRGNNNGGDRDRSRSPRAPRTGRRNGPEDQHH